MSLRPLKLYFYKNEGRQRTDNLCLMLHETYWEWRARLVSVKRKVL